MTDAVCLSKIVVATCACTGAAALSGRVGLPVVLVDATPDVADLLYDLNRTRHGGIVRSKGTGRGPMIEPGWDDWDVVPMWPDRPAATAAAAGVRFARGCIAVSLPDGTTLADFRAELRGALRHLAPGRVMDRPAYRWSRSGAAVAQPRYARSAAVGPTALPLRLVDDLVVLDPTIDGDVWRLFWLCVSARLAATVGDRSIWR